MWYKLILLYVIHLLSSGVGEILRVLDLIEKYQKYKGKAPPLFDSNQEVFWPTLPKLHLTNDTFYFTIKELPENVTAVNWYALIKPKREWNVHHKGRFDKLNNNTWLARNDVATLKPMQQMVAWFEYIVNNTWGYIEEVDDVILYDRKRKHIYENIRSRGPPGSRNVLSISPLIFDLPIPKKMSSTTESLTKTSARRNTIKRIKLLKRNATKRRKNKYNTKPSDDKL